MGELHLEVMCDRIVREHEIALDVGQPTVIFLETIRTNSDGEGKYMRQAGGRGQYAHVMVRLEPGHAGSGYQFGDEIQDGAIPAEFLDPVRIGIQEALKSGILASHEMVDLRAVLVGGSYHAEDSNDTAFKIAGAMAFKEAARKASPVILEPIMAIEVTTPEESAGAIVGDLSSRRGWIEGMERRSDSMVIRATVPLATMLGYAQHLRSIAPKRVEYSMNFARYEEVPRPGEWGADEAGVTANKPRNPKAGRGFAAAQWEEGS